MSKGLLARLFHKHQDDTELDIHLLQLAEELSLLDEDLELPEALERNAMMAHIESAILVPPPKKRGALRVSLQIASLAVIAAFCAMLIVPKATKSPDSTLQSERNAQDLTSTALSPKNSKAIGESSRGAENYVRFENADEFNDYMSTNAPSHYSSPRGIISSSLSHPSEGYTGSFESLSPECDVSFMASDGSGQSLVLGLEGHLTEAYLRGSSMDIQNLTVSPAGIMLAGEKPTDQGNVNTMLEVYVAGNADAAPSRAIEQGGILGFVGVIGDNGLLVSSDSTYQDMGLPQVAFDECVSNLGSGNVLYSADAGADTITTFTLWDWESSNPPQSVSIISGALTVITTQSTSSFWLLEEIDGGQIATRVDLSNGSFDFGLTLNLGPGDVLIDESNEGYTVVILSAGDVGVYLIDQGDAQLLNFESFALGARQIFDADGIFYAVTSDRLFRIDASASSISLSEASLIYGSLSVFSPYGSRAYVAWQIIGDTLSFVFADSAGAYGGTYDGVSVAAVGSSYTAVYCQAQQEKSVSILARSGVSYSQTITIPLVDPAEQMVAADNALYISNSRGIASYNPETGEMIDELLTSDVIVR